MDIKEKKEIYVTESEAKAVVKISGIVGISKRANLVDTQILTSVDTMENGEYDNDDNNGKLSNDKMIFSKKETLVESQVLTPIDDMENVDYDNNDEESSSAEMIWII